MSRSSQWAQVAVVGLALVAGCKGDGKVKDSPETLRSLSDCEKSKQDKDTYIKELEKRLAEHELKGGEEVVVTIEGEVLTISGIKGKGPHQASGVDKGDAKDVELYEAFLSAVKRSRGQVKQCYQNALKKNSALQARSIPMNIQVKYRTDGKVSLAQFSPRISADFDQCMENVAAGWVLPKMPKPVTFQSKITLTPE